MTAAVTVVIPTWNGAPFVEETLVSVAEQTFTDLRVVVSVDPSSDGTLGVCRRIARVDDRFEVHARWRRGGWVGNSNAALARVRTPLFVYMPHDDLLPPDYIEGLFDSLATHPDAICAYPDVEAFDLAEGVRSSPSMVGTPVDRVVQWLSGDLGAIPFRGLTRISSLRAGLRLREGRFGGFFADTLWVTELAAMGDCIRVPDVVYRKRVRTDSVVRGWESWPTDKKADATLDHFVELSALLDRAGFTPGDKQRALDAAIDRLSRIPHRWRPYATDLDRTRFLASLAEAIGPLRPSSLKGLASRAVPFSPSAGTAEERSDDAGRSVP